MSEYPSAPDEWAWTLRTNGEWTEVLDADGVVIAMFRDEHLAEDYVEWMNG